MINEMEIDYDFLLFQIIRKIKTAINPYGKPFEGTAYEFGNLLIKELEDMKLLKRYLEEEKNG